jgi:hypothetical protein
MMGTSGGEIRPYYLVWIFWEYNRSVNRLILMLPLRHLRERKS